jgi:hypothetical protein
MPSIEYRALVKRDGLQQPMFPDAGTELLEVERVQLWKILAVRMNLQRADLSVVQISDTPYCPITRSA